MTEGRSPLFRRTVKGSSFRGAGARPLGVEGRARLDERLGSWNERPGSSLYVVGALPLVL